MRGYSRIVTIATLTVAVVSLGVVSSDYAALAYQGHVGSRVTAALEASHSSFLTEKAKALAEGTPRDLLDHVTVAENALYAGAPKHPNGFVDRLWLADVDARAAHIDGYSREVVAIEAQVEVDLNQQVVAALQALQAGVQPARNAGVDTAAEEAFLATAMATAQDLGLPSAEARQLAEAKTRADALAAATADRVAANLAAAQALANAQADAGSQLTRAQRDLAAAQAITVLDVSAWVTAIPAQAALLATAKTASDFTAVANALRQQAAAIENLLASRQAAFQLLGQAQASLATAQGLKLSVSGDASQLAALAQALPQAATLTAINAARASITSIKNDLDFQVQDAEWRGAAGKLILISLSTQHLEALQDGVVLMQTDITSGRPALPTPPGRYHVLAKYSPYEMISPWPQGSPYYYYPSWVKMAMLFRDGGYFIHDAPWRSDYGPGSNLRDGTHGCVNVPLAGETWLWNWAPVGTNVVVQP